MHLLIGLALAGAPALDATPAETEAEDYSATIGQPLGDPVTDQELLDDMTWELGKQLRCPVCQGLSVSDSTSDAAVAMKNRVQELLAAGYSREQVLDYFADRYGEFILLAPPREGMHWLLWGAPVLATLAGLFWLLSNRRQAAPTTAAVAPTEDDPYRARILAELED